MKYFLLILPVFFVLQGSTQVKEQYYDFFGKPCDAVNARIYSTTQKTDSGWLRRDYHIYEKKIKMQALYEDSACKKVNGSMFAYHPNGRLKTLVRMVHNRTEGIGISWHSNGMMADSATYHNGIFEGSRITWHSNGMMADSVYHLNDSTDVHVQWFDDGTPASVGYERNGKTHGKWKFFHHNGALAGDVVYKKGKLVSCRYYNEDGSVLADSTKANSEAVFKKDGNKGWQNYLFKKVYWPANLKLTASGTVTIGVAFVITEDGKITDTEVYQPFHPEFDKIVLDVIRKSPAWQPAIQHNRKVKAYRRQPVSFVQPD